MGINEFRERYDYNPNCPISIGPSGRVYSAIDRGDGTSVALKFFNIFEQEAQLNLKKRIELLSTISHPNVCSFRNVHIIDCAGENLGNDERQNKIVIAVMDFVDGGILSKSIMMDFNHVEKILIGVVEGLAAIHSKLEIPHGNLNPTHILIEWAQNEPTARIVGLGHIDADAERANYGPNSYDVLFQAPEYSNTLNNGWGRRSTKIDFWSFGAIVCYLVADVYPKTIDWSVGANIFLAEHSDIPIVYQEIIKKCLIVDAIKRIGSTSELKEVIKKNLQFSDFDIQVDEQGINALKKLSNLLKWTAIGCFLMFVMLTCFLLFNKNNNKKSQYPANFSNNGKSGDAPSDFKEKKIMLSADSFYSAGFKTKAVEAYISVEEFLNDVQSLRVAQEVADPEIKMKYLRRSADLGNAMACIALTKMCNGLMDPQIRYSLPKDSLCLLYCFKVVKYGTDPNYMALSDHIINDMSHEDAIIFMKWIKTSLEHDLLLQRKTDSMRQKYLGTFTSHFAPN